MDRRTFLKNSAWISLLPLIGGITNACNPGAKKGRKIFVLLQLVGGNDGLNTLIPTDNYSNLVHARPNIYIKENKIIPLSGSQCGLHPSMEAVKELFDSKNMAFLQGVGYDNPNYSHFRSTDIWLSATDASKTVYTGWLARYIESQAELINDAFPPAIKIGETGSLLFEGSNMDVSVVIPSDSESYAGSACEPLASSLNGYAYQELLEIRSTLLQSDRYSKILDEAIKSSKSYLGSFPEKNKNPLADQLKMVARLIESDLSTPVYHVDFKGFDTHSEQVDVSNTTKGLHADLLAQLSEALYAFWNDITRMGKEDEVLVMVFSEFGRRIKANDSNGTDHGSAQPLMFLGKGLKGGIQGDNPIIPSQVSAGDNLAVQMDFRSVYAGILKDWFKCDTQMINQVLGAELPQSKLFL